MKLAAISLILLTLTAHAQYKLGTPHNSWGLDVSPQKNGPFKLKLGTRLQTVMKQSSIKNNAGGSDVNNSDFYLRRTRFQVQANYKEGIKFYMDVRNDDANKGNSGEGDFNVGDAYIEVKEVLNNKNLKFRAFRAKVDVSRTETVSSSKLMFLDRPYIADEAAQYVSHNRRASNVQLLGNYDNLYFQVVLGDGVQGAKMKDAKGNSLSSGTIDSQRFMIGGKVRLSPFKGWEDNKPTETYLGKGKHFSFGLGSFRTSGIEYRNSGNTQIDKVNRTLTNLEMSFHYQNLNIMSEYFKFNGTVEDFTVANKNQGSGDGYYIQGEYLMPKLSYIAPFVRYESWDKFKEKSDYVQTSKVLGLNWYLKGNNIRVGLFYQEDDFDSNLLGTTDARGRILADAKYLKLTSMWHY